MRFLLTLCSILILSFLLVTTSCAKRGFITGGAMDTIPPRMKTSTPKNYSTHFSGNEIKLVFDEYVKLKDVNKQLIISPPMNTDPVISPTVASRELRIKIKDTLMPNTTYSFNFGQSIQDNNEGNPINQFKYVFSTGSYIDSLFLEGRIKDAYNKKPDNFVSVMLYEVNEKFNDSTIYKEKPRYITNTLDSATTFRLENLKEGKYMLIALKDKNNNNKFDPKHDKIGFYNEVITIPDPSIYELELFKEELPFKSLKPVQASGNRLTMGYEGTPENLSVTVLKGEDKIPVRVTALPDKDSVQIWFPKQHIEDKASDSLLITVQKGDFEKEFSVKIKNQKTDTLSVTAGKSGSLHFRETFTLKTSTPLESHDLTKIQLLNKDSVAVPLKATYLPFKQTLELNFEKEEKEKYHLRLFPGALNDFFGKTNDTLTYQFTTREHTEYGNLRVSLSGVKSFPIIVELTDSKGDLKASFYSTGETQIDFLLLQPNLYTLRVIYDENKNGVWDTGSYLQKKQTEEVIYYPREIDVRANWDIEQTIDLNKK